MIKLNKKKLIANIFLSSMVLTQTVPTFANVLEDIDPVRHTVIEEEPIDEEKESFDDEIINEKVSSEEVVVLEDDRHVVVTEEDDHVTLETTDQLVEVQQTVMEEMEAQNETIIESYFSGAGDGSLTSPFQITTEAELNEMRNDLAAHYQLMNDITLTSDWIPVGYGTTLATKFTGSFTAEPGTVIRNMIVNTGVQLGDLHNRGFFGVTDGAKISEITLENSRVCGRALRK